MSQNTQPEDFPAPTTATPLSIGMVSDDFLPAMTGVGVYVQDLASELARRGHHVFVLTTRRKGEPKVEVWNGVRIYRLPTLKVYGFYQALPSLRLLRQIFAREHPNIIHHHYLGFMLKRVCRIALEFELPQVSTYHFDARVLAQPLLMRPFKTLIEKQALIHNNRFQLVIAPSLSLVQALKNTPIRTPIRFIPNWVTFTDEPVRDAPERSSNFTILFVGRLAVEKNIPLLLRAFQHVLTLVPNAQLHIIGDGPLRHNLQKECQRLGIIKNVQFLGFIEHTRIAEHYINCDVFVLPSQVEIYGLVALEAMWFGKPIIVTESIVSAKELVEEGVNGFIISQNSSNELAKRIIELATKTELRASMGTAGRKRAENYQRAQVISSLETSYHDTLSHSLPARNVENTVFQKESSHKISSPEDFPAPTTATPLSIGMVSDDFLPAMTGVGVHLQDLASELARRGHHVFVLTTRRKGEPKVEVWNGVRIYRLPTLKVYGFYQALPSLRLLRQIFAREHPNIIHHHYLGFLMKRVCVIAEELSLPQISTFHFSPELLTQFFLTRPFRRLVKKQTVSYNNRFTTIIAPSTSLVTELQSMGIQTPIRFVPNWVAFTEEDTKGTQDQAAPFTVLFVGRVSVEKNLSHLLRAFQEVLVTVPNARLQIVGEGPMREKLQAECHSLGITDNVKFLGFIEHALVARHYTNCDVFVLPSKAEINPLVALEAMWFGKPIIVTKSIISAEELVEQGVNGYIVDADSSTELTDRITALATTAELRTNMGAASRKRAEGYRLEQVIDSIETIYHNSLKT